MCHAPVPSGCDNWLIPEKCPACGRNLVELPHGAYKCPFDSIVWPPDRTVVEANPKNPKVQLQIMPASPSSGLSTAQRRWVNDVVRHFASNRSGQEKLAQILYGMFEGKTDFEEACVDFRVMSGAHIETIYETMRNAMIANPEALREAEAEGVQMPFMESPEERGKQGKHLKHLTVR